ncbi:response regulator [soil metagenome]
MSTHKKILLVDDDEDDLMTFKEALAEIEPLLACGIAKNGLAALVHLEDVEPLPSLIFLDLNMPVMNGIECLIRLKKTMRFKNIPVVILSTAGDISTRMQTEKLGADYFLTKASDFTVMKTQMREVLEMDFVGQRLS